MAAGGYFGRTGNEEYDRILAQVGEQMEKFGQAREELSGLRGHAKSADGQVTVEVLPTGSLAALKIDPRAMRMGSEALAEAILQAAQEAAKDAADRMNEIMRGVTGRSADLGQMLQGRLPGMDPSASGLDDPQLDRAMAEFQEMRRKYGV